MSDKNPATTDARGVEVVSPEGRAGLVALLVLALPTVAQMGGYTLVNFTDTLMLSRLGEVEATAAGNASLIGFALIAVGFGTMWVVNTLVSQAFGRGDDAACGGYLWAGVWVGVGFGIIVVPLGLVGGPVFRLLEHEAALADAEATYLGLVLLFTPVRLAAAAAGQFLLAVGRPDRTLVAAACGVVVNIAGNYVLIFGEFGFPRMGVAGAAWAANIGAAVELGVLAGFVLLPDVRRRFSVLDWRPGCKRVNTLLRVGLPSGGQMAADVLAWAVFGVWVMAAFGTNAMAANTFMMRYMAMSFLPAFGLGAAVTALVGRSIGAGRPDDAAAWASLGFRVTAVYMMTCGVIFALFGRSLIGVFTADPDILAMGATLMLLAAIYQFFDALYVIYLSALRGAGDTLVPAVVTTVLVWGMVVGVAGVFAYGFTGLGILGPWGTATVYGTLLGVYMWVRFRRGAWRSIRLEGVRTTPEPAPGAAFA